VKATEVTAGLAESNGSLLPGLWRDSLHVTCGLTACTPGSAPGPTLANEYGKTLPLPLCCYTQGEMTSRNLWSRYDRHVVGKLTVGSYTSDKELFCRRLVTGTH